MNDPNIIGLQCGEHFIFVHDVTGLPDEETGIPKGEMYALTIVLSKGPPNRGDEPGTTIIEWCIPETLWEIANLYVFREDKNPGFLAKNFRLKEVQQS